MHRWAKLWQPSVSTPVTCPALACPQIVYPYLRGNVADVVQRGGFPPVHLAEINFQAMYEQQQAEAIAAAAPQIIV